MAKDYYAILNISKNATDDEIKKAYRKLAIKYHPDKNRGAAAEERFKEIAEAYELLTDRKKRNIYDQWGACDNKNNCTKQTGGIFTYHFHGDPRATFAQFFGAANPFGAFYTTTKPSPRFETSSAKCTNSTMKTSTTTSPQPPSTATFTPTSTPPPPPPPPSFTATSKSSNSHNSTPNSSPQHKTSPRQDPPVQYDLYVSLEDIEKGCTKKMRILRMAVEENGQKRKEEKVLSIVVKPGWKEGTKITFEREGDRFPGRIPANIVFIIRDKPHPSFQRVGNDIRYKAVISLKRALCGTDIEVPTLQRDTILIDTHDEIILPNTVKCFPGRGLPFHREPTKRGNLFVDIVVKFPEGFQNLDRKKLNDALPD